MWYGDAVFWILRMRGGVRYCHCCVSVWFLIRDCIYLVLNKLFPMFSRWLVDRSIISIYSNRARSSLPAIHLHNVSSHRSPSISVEMSSRYLYSRVIHPNRWIWVWSRNLIGCCIVTLQMFARSTIQALPVNISNPSRRESCHGSDNTYTVYHVLYHWHFANETSCRYLFMITYISGASTQPFSFLLLLLWCDGVEVVANGNIYRERQHDLPRSLFFWLWCDGVEVIADGSPCLSSSLRWRCLDRILFEIANLRDLSCWLLAYRWHCYNGYAGYSSSWSPVFVMWNFFSSQVRG